MANKIPGSNPKCPDCATHPIIGGKAPGNAPTATAIGPTRFRGV